MTQSIIKSARVQVTAGQAPKVAPVRLVEGAAGCASGEKAVRLLEDQGRVIGIEFTCSCGEVTAVELLYPEGPKA